MNIDEPFEKQKLPSGAHQRGSGAAGRRAAEARVGHSDHLFA